MRLLLPWHRLPAAASREEVDRLEQEIGLRLQSPLVASYHDVREWISPFLSTHGDVEAALARALQCLAARDVVRVVGDPPSAVVQADAYTRCLGEIWRAAGAMQHDQRSLPSVPLAWLEERFSAPEFRGFLDADPTPGVLDLVLEDLARGRWGYRADTRRGAMVVVPSLLRWRRHEERPDLEMIVSAGWPGTVHDVWVLLLVHLVDLGAVRVIDRQGALVDLHNGVLLVDASERNGMAEITLSGTGVEDVDALIHLFRDRVTAYVPAGVRPEFIDVDPEGDQDVPSDAVLSRTCVSVLPFGKKQIGERDIDFDAVWRELFQPAIKATELPEGGSLKPVRYNAYGRRGNRLPGWIQNARLLLVDITGADPRRIVELGLLALRSQRIFLFHERSSPVPSEFDGMFVGLYDHPDDPRRLAAQRAMVTAALTEALLGAQRAADTTRLTEALRSPGGTRRSAGGETRPRWIYLSYASEDHEFAERFAEALKRRGLPVWIDLPSRLAGGDDFTWQISAVIAEAFVFVPLLSRNLRDARGRYFHMEWDRAMEVQRTMPENRRFIIPLRLDDEISWTDESVPPRLTELQWINARTDDEIEAAADQLRELYRRDQLARDLSADAGDAPQREGERDEPTTVEGSIYLSYAGEDHDRAQRLADALRQLSLPVFMSAEETLREDVSEHAIRAAVRNASVFVPFLSKNAQARKEGVFRLEWHAALDHAPRLGPNQRFIVPVVLDDELVTTRDIPNEFAHLQWMSARTAAEFESVASLLRDLYRSFRLAQARPSA
ncbi:MAG TPA: toll/interleukin-1 receptor domain-containing protein [Longimicrobium sp.]|nr:toll/interleukin-1 receptor domain-containing protein [Longimicrobium sp.]